MSFVSTMQKTIQNQKPMIIEVNEEQLDQLILQRLDSTCVMLEKDIRDLLAVGNLKPYQREDLRDNIRYLEAFKTVMSYYSADEIEDYDWTA